MSFPVPGNHFILSLSSPTLCLLLLSLPLSLSPSPFLPPSLPLSPSLPLPLSLSLPPSPCFSGADVYDRVSTFLESFHRDIEKGRCGENTIIVSHGLFCRLFLTRYYHWTVSKSNIQQLFMISFSGIMPMNICNVYYQEFNG